MAGNNEITVRRPGARDRQLARRTFDRMVKVFGDDAEALEFYTAVGGTPSKVTLFEFGTT